MNKEQLIDTLYWDMKVRDGCEKDISTMTPAEKESYVRSEARKMYFNKGERLFRYTLWMRLREYYPRSSPMWYYATMMYKKQMKKYPITMNCEPGKGFHIVHPSHSYLNAESIGEFFTAYQGVTLGVDRKGRKPVIGNHVTVYTNAVVCGGIHIGDYCEIGANAFVNHDLPDHTTVIAGSSIIKKQKETTPEKPAEEEAAA